MNLDYPKNLIDFIFVDESTDKTTDLLLSKSDFDERIKVISSKTRNGYSYSVREGIFKSEKEIVVLADSGSFYDKFSVKNLISGFTSENIGGTTGCVSIKSDNSIARKSEISYRKFYNFMRKGESIIDSTFHFHGELSAVRRNLVQDIKNIELPSVNLDIFIALHIRSKGFLVKLVPNAYFYEAAPKYISERYQQKKIRAFGLLSVILKFKRMFFNPSYGKFGLLIYPSHVFMMIIAPLLILINLLVPVILIFIDTPLALLVTISYLVLIAILAFFSKSLVVNLFQFEFILLQGLIFNIFNKNKSIFISKIGTTRDF